VRALRVEAHGPAQAQSFSGQRMQFGSLPQR
jgi:hypothetical protein